MSRYVDTPLENAAEVIDVVVRRAASPASFEAMGMRVDANQESVTALLAMLLDALTPIQVEALRIVATHVAQRAALDLVASMPRSE